MKKGVSVKRVLFTAVSITLTLAGLTLLIAPRISNRIGKEIAHSTVEEFRRLKSSVAMDEPPTIKEDSTSDSVSKEEETEGDSQKTEFQILYSETSPTVGTEQITVSVAGADFNRLYADSVAYNENLKDHQTELLVNEQSYKKPSLNLSDYGITSGVYGCITAPTIGLELPIYLGGNDDNMAHGAAHMTYTSLPIGGESTNCVLSGHTGYIGRIFFDYITELDMGDEIVIENYWNTLTYIPTITLHATYNSVKRKWSYESVSLNDSNSVLGKFQGFNGKTVDVGNAKVNIAVSGNKITLTPSNGKLTGTPQVVTVSCQKTGIPQSNDAALVPYSASGYQDLVTGGSITAPTAYFKVQVNVRQMSKLNSDFNIRKVIGTQNEYDATDEDFIDGALSTAENLEGWYFRVTVSNTSSFNYY